MQDAQYFQQYKTSPLSPQNPGRSYIQGNQKKSYNPFEKSSRSVVDQEDQNDEVGQENDQAPETIIPVASNNNKSDSQIDYKNNNQLTN